MKKKVFKDYKSLPAEIREDIRGKYPQGYVQDVITFFNKDKQLISALPYETEEISYLIKMPSSMSLKEDEETTTAPVETIPEGERIENIDEEESD
ncbi:MAG TPA: hypothetical protein ENI20_12705 [Bacteroides sp.]|nr:hypothetical protein [Bacteroides sp.]